jgi:putative endonuclease
MQSARVARQVSKKARESVRIHAQLIGGAKFAATFARMTVQRQRLGKRAEEIVVERLAAAGWRVVARNARTRYGEIDLIALDGATLVFVEVKAGRAGRGAGPERPAFAVHHRKQQRIRRLAAAWLATRPQIPDRFKGLRFDVVGLTFDQANHVIHWEHIRNAF